MLRGLRDLRRAAAWHRSLLAAGLAAASVAFALGALAPGPPETVAVLAAARDLPGGGPLAPDDVQLVRMPPAVAPAGALAGAEAAVGRVLAGPARRGEPLTDVRLLGPGLLAAAAGGRSAGQVVAAPVRVADAGSVALLRTGDRVDVLAASAGALDPTGARLPTAPPPADVVASDAVVLAVPRSDDSVAAAEGALVVLETTAPVAARLAAASVAARLSVVVRAPPG